MSRPCDTSDSDPVVKRAKRACVCLSCNRTTLDLLIDPEVDGKLICVKCLTTCVHCDEQGHVVLPRMKHDLKGMATQHDRLCHACSRMCERCDHIYDGDQDLAYDDLKKDWACHKCLCQCEGCFEPAGDEVLASRKGPFGDRMMRLCAKCVVTSDAWRK